MILRKKNFILTFFLSFFIISFYSLLTIFALTEKKQEKQLEISSHSLEFNNSNVKELIGPLRGSEEITEEKLLKMTNEKDYYQRSLSSKQIKQEQDTPDSIIYQYKIAFISKEGNKEETEWENINLTKLSENENWIQKNMFAKKLHKTPLNMLELTSEMEKKVILYFNKQIDLILTTSQSLIESENLIQMKLKKEEVQDTYSLTIEKDINDKSFLLGYFLKGETEKHCNIYDTLEFRLKPETKTSSQQNLLKKTKPTKLTFETTDTQSSINPKEEVTSKTPLPPQQKSPKTTETPTFAYGNINLKEKINQGTLLQSQQKPSIQEKPNDQSKKEDVIKKYDFQKIFSSQSITQDPNKIQYQIISVPTNNDNPKIIECNTINTIDKTANTSWIKTNIFNIELEQTPLNILGLTNQLKMEKEIIFCFNKPINLIIKPSNQKKSSSIIEPKKDEKTNTYFFTIKRIAANNEKFGFEITTGFLLTGQQENNYEICDLLEFRLDPEAKNPKPNVTQQLAPTKESDYPQKDTMKQDYLEKNLNSQKISPDPNQIMYQIISISNKHVQTVNEWKAINAEEPIKNETWIQKNMFAEKLETKPLNIHELTEYKKEMIFLFNKPINLIITTSDKKKVISIKPKKDKKKGIYSLKIKSHIDNYVLLGFSLTGEKEKYCDIYDTLEFRLNQKEKTKKNSFKKINSDQISESILFKTKNYSDGLITEETSWQPLYTQDKQLFNISELTQKVEEKIIILFDQPIDIIMNPDKPEIGLVQIKTIKATEGKKQEKIIYYFVIEKIGQSSFLFNDSTLGFKLIGQEEINCNLNDKLKFQLNPCESQKQSFSITESSESSIDPNSIINLTKRESFQEIKKEVDQKPKTPIKFKTIGQSNKNSKITKWNYINENDLEQNQEWIKRCFFSKKLNTELSTVNEFAQQMKSLTTIFFNKPLIIIINSGTKEEVTIELQENNGIYHCTFSQNKICKHLLNVNLAGKTQVTLETSDTLLFQEKI